METLYTWLNFGNTGNRDVVEIMGSLISDQGLFLEDIRWRIKKGCILCIGGELKAFGEGKPASNFRYEKDLKINSVVIDNYFQLINHHHDVCPYHPIFITSIPREMRKYSWFIDEDGTMIRKDHEYRRRVNNMEDPISYHGFPGGGESTMDITDENFMRFLSANCIEKEQMVKIRECCRGAKYHTYLVDMISFLYQLRCNDNEFKTSFRPEFRKLEVKNDGTKEQLYFNHTMERGNVFMCPKNCTVNGIYFELGEAISLKENPTKGKIRKHLMENNIHRWTDFSANDTDDAFTILMMIHSFNGLVGEKNTHGCSEGVYYKVSKDENVILEQLHKSLEHWRSQIG